MNGIPLLGLDRTQTIDLLSQHVQDSPQRLLSNRDRDGTARVDRLHSSNNSIRRLHRNTLDHSFAQMLSDLCGQVDGNRGTKALRVHGYGIIDCRDVP